MKTFSTEDNLLKIELADDDYVSFDACAGRMSFSSKADLLNIIINEEDEMFYIEFKNGTATTLHLHTIKEAKSIAKFLNVSLYKFAENGSDLVAISE